MVYLVIEDPANVFEDGGYFGDGDPTGFKLGGDSVAATDVGTHLDCHVLWFAGGRQDIHTASKCSL